MCFRSGKTTDESFVSLDDPTLEETRVEVVGVPSRRSYPMLVPRTPKPVGVSTACFSGSTPSSPTNGPPRGTRGTETESSAVTFCVELNFA